MGFYELSNALCHHGASYLHEAGNIGSLHIVDVTVGLCAIFHAVLMDVVHDGVQAIIDFFSSPLETL